MAIIDDNGYEDLEGEMDRCMTGIVECGSVMTCIGGEIWV